MKKQLLAIFMITGFISAEEPCEKEFKRVLHTIYNFYNQMIADLKRPDQQGKPYTRLENSPEFNFLNLNQKYYYQDIYARLEVLKTLIIKDFEKLPVYQNLEVQEDDEFLKISAPDSSRYAKVTAKLDEIAAMQDVLTRLYKEQCPALFMQSWGSWAKSWVPAF